MTSTAAPSTTWLRAATLADGTVADVRLDAASGTIADVVAPGRAGDAAAGAPGAPDGAHAVHDLTGHVLLPAFAEPHAHLDKALTADLVPNPTGDLMGAILAWYEHLPKITVAGMVDRARAAALELVASGVTAVRSHANVHPGIDLHAVEALLELRAELAGTLDVQIVTLPGSPLTGDGPGAEMRALHRAATALDPSILVGGAPHIDDDPEGAVEWCLELAGELGRPLDLHTDEQLNPHMLTLRHLARRVRSTGFSHPVTASHCVSLGVAPPDVQQAVAEEVAAAGIAVVTLPQTNLYLQGREQPTSPPRGLTAIRPLLAAGVTVAAGADNVRDPFNLMGRSDPLETAALLVMAGHLLPAEALHAVTDGARRALGLAPVRLAPGSPADLVAVRATSAADAVARGDAQRLVWRAGRLVAHSTVTRAFPGLTGTDSGAGSRPTAPARFA